MQHEGQIAAKRQVVAAMQIGQRWDQAVAQAGIQMGRSTAYRLVQRVHWQGDDAYLHHRHGYPTKCCEPVRAWLIAYWQQYPDHPARQVQAALIDAHGVTISVGHLNCLRRHLGFGRGKKRAPCIQEVCECAGSLLLLAAAHETGLLSALEHAVPAEPCLPRLTHVSPRSRQSSLLTLLFLPAVGLHRPWDLRGYTGNGLALLTTRRRAYGYWHIERFLTQLAASGASASFTTALVQWTAVLWKTDTSRYYVDGHRKAVYSDVLLPRGLIGRTGKILSCRALTLLHDDRGHPLLITTHRGDQHLTIGLPAVVAAFKTATHQTVEQIVVDREGMAGDLLAKISRANTQIVTLLRSDQYTGLDSFTDVGEFVPLERDCQEKVIREVAAARYVLPIPSEPGEMLPLTVALIRDLRRQEPCPPSDEEERRPWYDDLPDRYGWTESDWKATPAPAPPTTPKLIPIVTTAPECDPITLAHWYAARWPVQENVIKDWLLPLGLDINHGYAKVPTSNSEVAKRREALEKRLNNVRRWSVKAKDRSHRAGQRSQHLWKETKLWGEEHYRELDLFAQTVEDPYRLGRKRHPLVVERKNQIDEELQARWARYHQSFDLSNQEYRKHERYCREQRDLLRDLEDLGIQERQMFEVNHDKDHLMTVCKTALANLGMWLRDHYFPKTYVQATWHRLAPFFHLAGRITWEPDNVTLELHPFNDRRLNRDLAAICQRFSASPLHLPDGRLLHIMMHLQPRTLSG